MQITIAKKPENLLFIEELKKLKPYLSWLSQVQFSNRLEYFNVTKKAYCVTYYNCFLINFNSSYSLMFTKVLLHWIQQYLKQYQLLLMTSFQKSYDVCSKKTWLTNMIHSYTLYKVNVVFELFKYLSLSIFITFLLFFTQENKIPTENKINEKQGLFSG